MSKKKEVNRLNPALIASAARIVNKKNEQQPEKKPQEPNTLDTAKANALAEKFSASRLPETTNAEDQQTRAEIAVATKIKRGVPKQAAIGGMKRDWPAFDEEKYLANEQQRLDALQSSQSAEATPPPARKQDTVAPEKPIQPLTAKGVYSILVSSGIEKDAATEMVKSHWSDFKVDTPKKTPPKQTEKPIATAPTTPYKAKPAKKPLAPAEITQAARTVLADATKTLADQQRMNKSDPLLHEIVTQGTVNGQGLETLLPHATDKQQLEFRLAAYQQLLTNKTQITGNRSLATNRQDSWFTTFNTLLQTFSTAKENQPNLSTFVTQYLADNALDLTKSPRKKPQTTNKLNQSPFAQDLNRILQGEKPSQTVRQPEKVASNDGVKKAQASLGALFAQNTSPTGHEDAQLEAEAYIAKMTKLGMPERGAIMNAQKKWPTFSEKAYEKKQINPDKVYQMLVDGGIEKNDATTFVRSHWDGFQPTNKKQPVQAQNAHADQTASAPPFLAAINNRRKEPTQEQEVDEQAVSPLPFLLEIKKGGKATTKNQPPESPTHPTSSNHFSASVAIPTTSEQDSPEKTKPNTTNPLPFLEAIKRRGEETTKNQPPESPTHPTSSSHFSAPVAKPTTSEQDSPEKTKPKEEPTNTGMTTEKEFIEHCIEKINATDDPEIRLLFIEALSLSCSSTEDHPAAIQANQVSNERLEDIQRILDDPGNPSLKIGDTTTNKQNQKASTPKTLSEHLHKMAKSIKDVFEKAFGNRHENNNDRSISR